MMVGKTTATLQRNVLNDIRDLVGEKNFRWVNRQQGELSLLGRRVHCVGASSEDAESKIRGVTLAGALCDEVNLYPKAFFAQLIARCSVAKAQIFCNCNPDSPYHWFYTDYIKNDRITDKKVWQFLLDDNPNLDPDYVISLKQTYTGVFYRRFILGEWCIAEGAIYDMFNADIHVRPAPVLPKYPNLLVGCDYGTSSVMSWSLFWKMPDGTYFKIKEYFYDARKHRVQKTDGQFYKDFIEWLGPLARYVQIVYCDPSATSWIAELRNGGLFNVQKADNDVLNGIRVVGDALAHGRLYFDPSCVNTIAEYPSYMWDPDRQAQGIDKPIKLDDHALDSDRYVIYTDTKHGGGGIYDVV